jgi:hypothetical protein
MWCSVVWWIGTTVEEPAASIIRVEGVTLKMVIYVLSYTESHPKRLWSE